LTIYLIGCPEDIMTNSQIGGLSALVGKWNFVNETLVDSMKNSMEDTGMGPAMEHTGISGTMLFNNNGYMKMTVPTKTGFGPYTLEGSWAYIGQPPNILTICYASRCENNTLTITTPNHIEFTDPRGDTIHLMR
jgi:hypothetical protein